MQNSFSFDLPSSFTSLPLVFLDRGHELALIPLLVPIKSAIPMVLTMYKYVDMVSLGIINPLSFTFCQATSNGVDLARQAQNLGIETEQKIC